KTQGMSWGSLNRMGRVGRRNDYFNRPFCFRETQDSQVPEERMAQKDKRGLRDWLGMRVPQEQQERR
ncbi:hypothetical protein ACQP3J_31290, partial [Escherichia coli]